MDKLLAQHPIHKYSNYKHFIRDLIQNAISNQGYTFDNLNYELYRLNSDIYQEYIKELIADGNLIATHVYTSR